MFSVDVATPENERQQSVNHFRCCILYKPRAVLWLLPTMEVLDSFIGNMVNVDVATPKNECQQSDTRASTILGVASCIIQGHCYGFHL